MAKEYFFNLQHSESVIASMAATIYAAYIQKSTLDENQEEALIAKAAAIAIKLADHVDRSVKSDQEWMKANESNHSML